MTEWQIVLVGGAVVTMAIAVWQISSTLIRIETQLRNLADAVAQANKLTESQNGEIHHAMLAIDRLWSPLKSVSNVLWQKAGLDGSIVDGADD